MGLFTRKKTNVEQERSFFPETQIVYGASLFQGELDPIVAACVDKIANSLSTLPIQLYAHTKNGKRLAIGHPLFSVLEHPAYEETPTLWYGTLIRHILLKGNGYVYVSKKNGDPVNLSIVDPNKVQVQRDSNYRKTFTIDGKLYTEREILHIPYNGPGYNGTVGVSPVTIHRDLIKLHSDLLLYISTYFNNSLGTRYALELGATYPSKPADLDKIYASIIPVVNKYVAGASNAGKLMVPPPDTKMSKIEQSSNVQAQLDSLLKMVEKQICEAFNVPYEVIDSSTSKYNSLEAKQQDFLNNCILPFGNHLCESFERLIQPADSRLFIAYDYKNMLTTDVKTTIDYLRSEVQSGLLTVNEARSKLGMDDIGEAGDTYWMPSNLMPMTLDVIDAYMAKSKIALQEAELKTENQFDLDHSPAGDDKV